VSLPIRGEHEGRHDVRARPMGAGPPSRCLLRDAPMRRTTGRPQTSTPYTAYTYTGTGCTGGLSVNGNKKPQTTQRNGKHARAHANPRRYMIRHDDPRRRVCRDTLTEL
jgi:hypothetical protein